jgi:sigma-54 dependent transcriptional regulator, acetoin dehydrogenase operon transcriptional activator AcoR
VALREAGGDRNAVAARLGISRATVYRKLKRYQLH